MTKAGKSWRNSFITNLVPLVVLVAGIAVVIISVGTVTVAVIATLAVYTNSLPPTQLLKLLGLT